jgi:hypothetical protein
MVISVAELMTVTAPALTEDLGTRASCGPARPMSAVYAVTLVPGRGPTS